jgi:RPA family protein
VDVSGVVLKRVKRSGECKLVIAPGASVPGFVVFADCIADEETVISRGIRKGSFVSICGKFQTFGALAVCLSDCRLREIC